MRGGRAKREAAGGRRTKIGKLLDRADFPRDREGFFDRLAANVLLRPAVVDLRCICAADRALYRPPCSCGPPGLSGAPCVIVEL